MKKYVAVLLVAAAIALMAQTPFKLVDGNGAELILAAGGKSFDSGLIAVGATATTLASATTKVQLIFCNNTTAGAVTLLVTDGQGSPLTYFPTISMAANSATVLHSGAVGMTMSGGVKATAGSGSAINCQVVGVQ